MSPSSSLPSLRPLSWSAALLDSSASLPDAFVDIDFLTCSLMSSPSSLTAVSKRLHREGRNPHATRQVLAVYGPRPTAPHRIGSNLPGRSDRILARCGQRTAHLTRSKVFVRRS